MFVFVSVCVCLCNCLCLRVFVCECIRDRESFGYQNNLPSIRESGDECNRYNRSIQLYPTGARILQDIDLQMKVALSHHTSLARSLAPSCSLTLSICPHPPFPEPGRLANNRSKGAQIWRDPPVPDAGVRDLCACECVCGICVVMIVCNTRWRANYQVRQCKILQSNPGRIAGGVRSTSSLISP